jgi:hypothetical protein
MSYSNQCNDSGFGCERLLYFANPSNTYLGEPMGDAVTADGTHSLNNTRSTVASFRTTSSPPPSISITDASVTEGNSGYANAAFNVTLSAASSYPVTVKYETANNTARAGISNFESISNDWIQTSNRVPSSAAGDPYPSTITAPSGIGPITNLKVRINQFNHTWPRDVDILLQGPGGQTVVLMSDVGSDVHAVNVDFTFDDSGATLGSGVLTSGTYKPTNISDGEGSDVYHPPAPSGPYGSTLSVFNGTDPAGTWKLWMMDDMLGSGGSITGGWTLVLTPVEEDYVGASGTLTFAPGVTSQTVNVAVVGDTVAEPDETFFVNLSSPTNATIADGQAVGTILNNDGPVTKRRLNQVTSN